MHFCVHDPALIPYKRPLKQAYHRLWIYGIEKTALAHAQCTVAVSHYTAQAVRTTFGSRPVEVILNWVDTDFFYANPAHPAQRHGSAAAERRPLQPIVRQYVIRLGSVIERTRN